MKQSTTSVRIPLSLKNDIQEYAKNEVRSVHSAILYLLQIGLNEAKKNTSNINCSMGQQKKNVQTNA